jgi:hypothetical protein
VNALMSPAMWTPSEWDSIEHAARQVRTCRSFEAAGHLTGNEPQRLGMRCSARRYEGEVRRFARLAIAKVLWSLA